MKTTIEEDFTISKIAVALTCMAKDIEDLDDSDNKKELVNWLNISIDMLRGIVVDDCTIVKEEAEELEETTLS